MKKVKSESYRPIGGHGAGKRVSSIAMQGDINSRSHFSGDNYADSDGLETIDDWRCVEGCVVRRLGEQSGILKSGAKNLVQNGWGDHGIYGQGKPHLKESIASKGTAARFYFQADWSYERIEDEELWQHGE